MCLSVASVLALPGRQCRFSSFFFSFIHSFIYVLGTAEISTETSLKIVVVCRLVLIRKLCLNPFHCGRWNFALLLGLRAAMKCCFSFFVPSSSPSLTVPIPIAVLMLLLCIVMIPLRQNLKSKSLSFSVYIFLLSICPEIFSIVNRFCTVSYLLFSSRPILVFLRHFIYVVSSLARQFLSPSETFGTATVYMCHSHTILVHPLFLLFCGREREKARALCVVACNVCIGHESQRPDLS